MSERGMGQGVRQGEERETEITFCVSQGSSQEL